VNQSSYSFFLLQEVLIDIQKLFANLNAATTVLAGMSWYLRNRVTISQL